MTANKGGGKEKRGRTSTHTTTTFSVRRGESNQPKKGQVDAQKIKREKNGIRRLGHRGSYPGVFFGKGEATRERGGSIEKK